VRVVSSESGVRLTALYHGLCLHHVFLLSTLCTFHQTFNSLFLSFFLSFLLLLLLLMTSSRSPTGRTLVCLALLATLLLSGVSAVCTSGCTNDGPAPDCTTNCHNDGDAVACTSFCYNNGAASSCTNNCYNTEAANGCQTDCGNGGDANACTSFCYNNGTAAACASNCTSGDAPNCASYCANPGVAPTCASYCSNTGPAPVCASYCSNKGDSPACKTYCSNEGDAPACTSYCSNTGEAPLCGSFCTNGVQFGREIFPSISCFLSCLTPQLSSPCSPNSPMPRPDKLYSRYVASHACRTHCDRSLCCRLPRNPHPCVCLKCHLVFHRQFSVHGSVQYSFFSSFL